ncbi:pilus assembly protein PilM [Rubrobacter xylanophilus]|uniref:Pilus assembly protein PilM n=2 Tax=Rubrobacter xylanophilus TaxID=49319 RepID=A0A510HJZ5_9ACTN|nr:pilus assembly protein PilM [Rubrobacter xylanophilus]
MDIDRSAIKAVQLSGSPGDYALEHVGYHRLPEGVVSGGEVADPELLAAEIRTFWESHSFRGRSVFLGVANEQVVVRFVSFPRMEPAELEGALNFQAQDYIPMPLEEAVLDHAVLGPSPENPEEDGVLLVAARKEMVLRFSAALRSGGLRPVGVDVKALCLLRSALPAPFFEDEGDVVLLDVGSELSNLLVAAGGRPSLVRFLPLGVADFVQRVSETADLPADQAEKLVFEPGVGLGGVPDARPALEEEETAELPDPALVYDVRRGLEEASRVLAEEVQRSAEYHRSQPGSREVSLVILSGEAGLIPGITAHLSELLGLPVEPANPLARISTNRSNVSDEQLRAMEPVLAVALGLAMEDGAG